MEKTSKNEVTEKEIKEAMKLREKGMYIRDIAVKMNRSVNTVRRMLVGFYDEKEDTNTGICWKDQFYYDWMHTVNKIRKAVGRKPL